MIDVIIIIACVAVVGLTIFLSIRNKKKGKSSCGCDCSTCNRCSKGAAKKPNTTNPTNNSK